MIISTKATYILLSLIGLLWGFQPITLKWLLPYWTPATITTFRFLVVGMVILFYQYFRLGRDMAKLLPRKTDWPWIVFMGINGQMLNSVLQFHGLQFTTVTNSTLITATTPAITSVCAYLILHEAFSKKQWLGILLSFSGVLAVITKGNFDIIRTMSFNCRRRLLYCIPACLGLLQPGLTKADRPHGRPYGPWLVQSLRDSRNRYLWDFFKHPCPFSLAACSLSFLSLYHPFRRDCRQCLLEHWRQECRSQRQFRLFEFHARHGNGCRVSHFCRSHRTAPDCRSQCDFCRGIPDDAWLIFIQSKNRSELM